ncbi:predicted protein [Chaetoceros tenuissimus]|uniref:Uncharacterized protein n=1 Tax=Chaetoceros tenuissimus TaxID=426638 RepID=A0AAD3D1K2_9STRA|nr:predicted protein [Chaetoceros tenuissimus]
MCQTIKASNMNPIDHVHRSKKRRRANRVSFASSKDNSSFLVHSTQEDRDNAWYSKEDLTMMRMEVKEQAKLYKIALEKRRETSHASTERDDMSSLVMPFCNSEVDRKLHDLCTSLSSSDEYTELSFRGLEPRIFIEMQRNRTIAIKTVLEYQRRTQDLLTTARTQHHTVEKIQELKEVFSQRLGRICSELSMWARHEALSIASYDETGNYDTFTTLQCVDDDEKDGTNHSIQNKAAPKLREREINKHHIELVHTDRDHTNDCKKTQASPSFSTSVF